MHRNKIGFQEQSNFHKVSFFAIFTKAMGLFMGTTFIYLIVFIAFKGRVDNYYYELLKNSQTQLDSYQNQMQFNQVIANEEINGFEQDSTGNNDNPDNGAILIKKPQSVEEIVAYYNASHDKVKTQAKSVTIVNEKASNYNNVVETGGSKVLARICKSVMDKFLTENTERRTYTGNDIYNEFPPAGAKCNLKPSDVSQAQCVDKGDYYEITIHINPDTNPQPGFGTGAVASIITQKEITDAVEGYIEISDIKCNYENVYVVSKIDKSSGNMTSEYVCMPMYLSLTALGLNCNIGLQFEESWEVEW